MHLKHVKAIALALALAGCATNATAPKLTVVDRTAGGCLFGGATGAGVGYGLVAAGLLAFPVAIPVAVMAGALIGGPFGCGIGFVSAKP